MAQIKPWVAPKNEWVPLYIFDDFEIHPQGAVRRIEDGSIARTIHRSGVAYVQLDRGARTGFYLLADLLLNTWPKPKPVDNQYAWEVFAAKYDHYGATIIENLYWTADKNSTLRSGRWADALLSLPCRIINPGSYTEKRFSSIIEAAKHFGLDPVDVGKWCQNSAEEYGWIWGIR